MTCPACGADVAAGSFCLSCGATLGPERCPSCGGEVTAGAHFCQLCGKPVGTHQSRGRALPWVIAGATVAALSAVLLVRLTSPKAAPAAGGPSADGAGTAMAAPDISNMSPRERAGRLYNRVMSAAERGDTGEVRFFVPMARQSYALLGLLDADARYHLGVIQFVSHDYAAALAETDSIIRESPGHLLANALRAQVAIARGDTVARNRAYRAFLQVYDREMATRRNEYAEHAGIIARTRTDARAAGNK